MEAKSISHVLRCALENTIRKRPILPSRPFLYQSPARALHTPPTPNRLPLSAQLFWQGRTHFTPRHHSTAGSLNDGNSLDQRSDAHTPTKASHTTHEDQRPLTDRNDASSDHSNAADEIALRKALSPAYQLWFTCKQCQERSGHTVSKQSYHFGTTVIRCPKCKSQHLISDHLKIFSDTSMTMEDIMRQHGQLVKKGRLGADGDMEFYDDAATEKIQAAQQAQLEDAGKLKS